MKTMNDSALLGGTLLGGCYGCKYCGGLLNLSELESDLADKGFFLDLEFDEKDGLKINRLTTVLQELYLSIDNAKTKKEKQKFMSYARQVENIIDQMKKGKKYKAWYKKEELDNYDSRVDDGLDLYAIMQNPKSSSKPKRLKTAKPRERIITGQCYAKKNKNGKWMRWVDGKLATKEYYDSICGPIKGDKLVGPRKRKTGDCKVIKNSRGVMMRYVDGKLKSKKDYEESVCGKTASKPVMRGKKSGAQTKHDCNLETLQEMIDAGTSKSVLNKYIKACYSRTGDNPIKDIGASTYSSYLKKKKN